MRRGHVKTVSKRLLPNKMRGDIQMGRYYNDCNATCFSLFPDAGMADLLGALDSRNGGE
jgi:hypothetical protein